MQAVGTHIGMYTLRIRRVGDFLLSVSLRRRKFASLLLGFTTKITIFWIAISLKISRLGV